MANGTRAQDAPILAPSNGVMSGPAPPSGNRKNRKKRAKNAAKQEPLPPQHEPAPLEHASYQNGHGSLGLEDPLTHPDYDDPDQFDPIEGDEIYYSEDDEAYEHPYASQNGAYGGAYGDPHAGGSHLGPKKKKKSRGNVHAHHSALHHLGPHIPPPPPPPLSSTEMQSGRQGKKDRIWNTSTQEERQRIKEFWLSLGEDERKSLVKIEKEAVLRKMKEQQKHSCSCTVCGRKRTAIEEELEVLYDAYYEELEQYAHYEPGSVIDSLPSSRRFGQPIGHGPPDRMPPMLHSHPGSRSRIKELVDDEEEDEEEELIGEDEFSDEVEYYSDDEEPEEPSRGAANDFFNFGNSLTVKGGILTVADDLLKNDGKKFIEMMEQLAERRMQREEEAHHHATHSLPEEDDYEDEDEDEYDSQEDEYDDEDEMDTMTEEQRMEEGRRMFQIFAARMFEQRVLHAYREKVAAERQQRLLDEILDDEKTQAQREAKKQRDAQKKKDKKAQQKQQKAEEKARKEAEKTAEEAAAKAEEEKRQEEQRRKKEEARKKKEAEKKAQEEEKQRKEADRLKRQQEERERQNEAERKLREQKAAEKKAKDDAKKKEREDREAKEKALQEKKAQEAHDRKQREAKVKADKEAEERARRETETAQAQQRPQPTKRQSHAPPVALPPGLKTQQSASPSPHIPIATPAIPKAPTPNRPRQSSQQGSHGSSPKTPSVHPGTSKSLSPTNPAPQHLQNAAVPKQILQKPHNQQQPTPLHHPQPQSPMQPLGPPPGMQQPFGNAFGSLPGFPQSQPPFMPSTNQRLPSGQHMPGFPHQQPPMGGRFPNFYPNGMPPPPGMGAPGMMPHGRGFPMEAPPGFNQPPGLGAPAPGFGAQRENMPSHSRQQSASFEKPTFEPSTSGAAAQPIARPAPIQRPSSVKPDDSKNTNADVDELSRHLGSSALLADDDTPPLTSEAEARRNSMAPSRRNGPSLGFGTTPLFTDQSSAPFGIGSPSVGSSSTWGTPAIDAFGPPSVGQISGWGNSPTMNWGSGPFAFGGGPRPSVSRPRHVQVRLMVCQACRHLDSQKPTADRFHDVNAIHQTVDTLRGPADPFIDAAEIVDITDTEGDGNNGGGSFEVRQEAPNRTLIRYDADTHRGSAGPGPGEIGSPFPGHSMPAIPIGGNRNFSSLGGIGSPLP